jgi:hypothetical protein
MPFALALLVAVTALPAFAPVAGHARGAGSSHGPAFSAATGAVDFFQLLSDANEGFQPVCCCSLRGIAEERTLAGAAQPTLQLKPAGDAYEVYLELGPTSFVYVGTATKPDAASMNVFGVNGTGALTCDLTAEGWVWTAWDGELEVGTGTMS